MSEPHHDRRTAIHQLLGSGPVAYYPALAAIAGGVTAGVFLAQLFYWHDKGRDPDGWIYKTQAEWQAETGLTRTEQETARRRLRERGMLEEKLAGLPARLYYRLDADRMAELLAAQASADEGRRPPRGERRDQDCGIAADKDAETLQSSMLKPCNQGCGNPAHKFAGIPQTSVRESRRHAENTRDHNRQHGAQSTAVAGSPVTICSLHGAPMKLRRKNGATWYSHRLPDGSWCQGGPRDPPDDRVDPHSWAHRREYATQFGWEVSLTAPVGPRDAGANEASQPLGEPPPARGAARASAAPPQARRAPSRTPDDPPRARLPSRSEGSATPTNRSPPGDGATHAADHSPAGGANPRCRSDLPSDIPIPPPAARNDTHRSQASASPTSRSPPGGAPALDADPGPAAGAHLAAAGSD